MVKLKRVLRDVDFQACDSVLECYADHLRLDDFYLQVLTLKDPPAQTFANLLRGLQEVTCSVLVVSEWQREESAKMRSAIQSKRRHFHKVKSSMMNYLASSGEGAPKDMLVNDSAAALVADVGAALQEMELKGHAFGQFSMTIILYSEDRATVRSAVAQCFKVSATHDGQLTEERYNLFKFLAGNQEGRNTRSVSVAVLNKKGRNLLKRTDKQLKATSQALYTGFVKPREIAHELVVQDDPFDVASARFDVLGLRLVHPVDRRVKKKAYPPLAKARAFARRLRSRAIRDHGRTRAH